MLQTANILAALQILSTFYSNLLEMTIDYLLLCGALHEFKLYFISKAIYCCNYSHNTDNTKNLE